MAPAGTTTRAPIAPARGRGENPEQGQDGELLAQKRHPERHPDQHPPTAQCLRHAGTHEPHADEVLGVERLGDGVGRGRYRRQCRHHEHLRHPTPGSHRPHEHGGPRRQHDPRQDGEQGLGPVPDRVGLAVVGAVAGGAGPEERPEVPRAHLLQDGGDGLVVAPPGRPDPGTQGDDERRRQQRVTRGIGYERLARRGGQVAVGDRRGRQGHGVGIGLARVGPAPHEHDDHEDGARPDIGHDAQRGRYGS